MSLTDNNGTTMTMPVQPMYGSGGGSGFGGMNGFGNDGWWIILLLLCLGGGWGNGFGNNGTNDLAYLAMANGGFGGNLPGYSQTNDFSNLERENDIIRQDICTNFASVNQALANGFQGIQTSFANAELSRSNTQAALMNQMYNMSMANQQNVCDVRSDINTGFANTSSAIDRGFADTNYNLATQGCDTRNTIQNAIRDAVDSQREGTNAILTALNAQRIEAKDDKIAELNAQLAEANNRALMNGFMASQANQTEGLKDYVANQFALNNPRPVPAFGVPAPYQYGNCGCNGNF